MKNLEFQVVCEGVSDFETLKIILSEFGKEFGATVRANRLSPAEDETSRVRERGGWGSVRAWCCDYGARRSRDNEIDLSQLQGAGIVADRIRKPYSSSRWTTLLTLTKATGLIVHLDSDVAEKICDQPQGFCTSGLSPKEYCRQAIESWMEAKESSDLCFVVATHCTETWFLALHDNITDPHIFSKHHDNYENIQDVIERLLALNYRSYVDQETGRVTIDKRALTEEQGSDLAKGLHLIASRCAEVQRVKNYVKLNSKS